MTKHVDFPFLDEYNKNVIATDLILILCTSNLFNCIPARGKENSLGLCAFLKSRSFLSGFRRILGKNYIIEIKTVRTFSKESRRENLYGI